MQAMIGAGNQGIACKQASYIDQGLGAPTRWRSQLLVFDRKNRPARVSRPERS